MLWSRLTLFAICILPALVAGEIPAPLTGEALRRLVEQLGADDFDVRTAAHEALRKAGDAARETLEAAQSSDDAEIRSRVRQLLLPIKQREAAAAELRGHLGPLFGADDMRALPSEAAPREEGAGPIGCTALNWLASAQEDDGHWDSIKHGAQRNADIEQTAFALLAFLGVGHTEKVGMYKQNVQRAVGWLIKQQREDGAILRNGEREVDGLAHAVAGLALCEAAGMGNQKSTKEAAQKAVDYSCNGHQAGAGVIRGGFGRRPRSETPDLFTTTFFVMQLKSAKIAGLKVPPESFDGIITFLDSLDGPEGFRFAKGQTPSQRATILGLLCRCFLGWKREDLHQQAMQAFKAYGDPDAESADDLWNYLGVLTAFQQGGEIWKDFHASLQPSVIRRMRRSGDHAGSWDPRCVWSDAGRVFSTATNGLALEIYDRWHQLKD